MTRVAFVGVFHETNTFSPLLTTRDDFAARWYRGEELRKAFAGTRTVGGGFFDGGAEHGFEIVPIFGAFATPSGPVTAETFDAILQEIEDGLRAADGIDAVLLELHGDLFVQGRVDPEDDIVELIRRTVPGRTVSGVTDLHANMAVPRLRGLDVHVGYRTNPHVDTWETGFRAAALLADVLADRLDPVRAHAGVAYVAPPSVQLTANEPLRGLLALADELERDERLRDVSVHAGYAYGDSASTGLGFSATADRADAELAEQAVATLRAEAIRTISAFERDFATPEDAVAQAVAGQSPVVIADTGDNINGGSPGDTTWLLHIAAQYPGRTFLTTIADRAALGAARAAGVGGSTQLSIGGKASGTSGHPINATVDVAALGDGVFHNEGPMARGNRIDMDGAAVVTYDNVTVLLQGVPVQPNDSAMFRSLGLTPEAFDVICLKGAAAVRADWAPRVSEIIDAGTVGETDQVLSRLTYERANLVPLDELA